MNDNPYTPPQAAVERQVLRQSPKSFLLWNLAALVMIMCAVGYAMANGRTAVGVASCLVPIFLALIHAYRPRTWSKNATIFLNGLLASIAFLAVLAVLLGAITSRFSLELKDLMGAAYVISLLCIGVLNAANAERREA
jgi:hypothetical protein